MFEGSPPAAGRFVREWREAHRGPDAGYLEPGRPAGTAQAACGECLADVGGSRERPRALVVSFPHSNARFEVLTRAQRSENACWALAGTSRATGRAPAAPVPDDATECGRRAGEVVRESAPIPALRAHHGRRPRPATPTQATRRGPSRTRWGSSGGT